MKRAFLFALALGLAGPVFAQDGISRPAGFVRFDLAPQSQTLVSLPLEPFYASLPELLSAQLDEGDRLLMWNAEEQRYTTAGAAPAAPGDAFWIERNQATSRSVYLFGHAVLEESVDKPLQPLLNLQGYPYTTAQGDWDLGEGDWLVNAQTQTALWTVARPYADVFDSEDSSPRIEGIALASNGVALALDVGRFGDTPLAILYQDLARTSALDTAHGWVVAEPTLMPGGATLVWADIGSTNRLPPSKVFARLYLVIAADRDANGNGVPDVNELGDLGTLAIVEAADPADQLAGTASAESLQDGLDAEAPAAAAATNAAPGGFIITYDKPVIYVDAVRGSDQYTGKEPVRVGQDGPKKTIGAGISAAEGGGSVVVGAGTYRESVHVAGRDVSVIVGPDAVLTAVGISEPVLRASAIDTGAPTNEPGAGP